MAARPGSSHSAHSTHSTHSAHSAHSSTPASVSGGKGKDKDVAKSHSHHDAEPEHDGPIIEVTFSSPDWTEMPLVLVGKTGIIFERPERLLGDMLEFDWYLNDGTKEHPKKGKRIGEGMLSDLDQDSYGRCTFSLRDQKHNDSYNPIQFWDTNENHRLAKYDLVPLERSNPRAKAYWQGIRCGLCHYYS